MSLYLKTLVEEREAAALRQYRWARGRQSGRYDEVRFIQAIAARAEWNALHALAEAERR